MYVPFLRRSHPVLWLGSARATLLDPAWTRDGLRVRRLDTLAGGESGMPPGPSRRGTRARVVTVGLPPALVRHRIEALPDGDDEERESWIEQRRERFAAERAGDRAAACVLGGDSPRLLLGAAPEVEMERLERALSAAGYLPYGMVSVLPLLGYAIAPDEPADAYSVRLGSVGVSHYRLGLLEHIEDEPSETEGTVTEGVEPDELQLLVPLHGSPSTLSEGPSAVSTPGSLTEDTASFEAPAYALALSDRLSELPRLDFLGQSARLRALVALDRLDALRVIATLSTIAVLVAGATWLSLQRAEGDLRAAQARASETRPNLRALEAAEAEVLALPAPRPGLAPVLDAIGRRAPVGLLLTEVSASRRDSAQAAMSVRGMAGSEALVATYLDALAANPDVKDTRLQVLTRLGTAPTYVFALDLRTYEVPR